MEALEKASRDSGRWPCCTFASKHAVSSIAPCSDRDDFASRNGPCAFGAICDVFAQIAPNLNIASDIQRHFRSDFTIVMNTGDKNHSRSA